jgi:hypothetical protein
LAWQQALLHQNTRICVITLMAQGVMDRLTYERLGVILTDAPAYKEAGSKYKDLIRVQNMSYDLTHQSTDIKAIGADELVTRDGQSPVVRAPDVSCDIGYLFTNGLNENNIGFHLSKNGSVLKNFLLQNHTDDINILIVSSNKNENEDLVFLESEQDFENFNIIGIGNAFLSRYAYSASIGQFASSTISYGGSNIQFDLYSEQNRPKLPAVKLGANNIRSEEVLELAPGKFTDFHHSFDKIFDSHVSPEISAISPGTINATIFKINGDRGGAVVDSVNAAIQNINIDLPIPRQAIYGLGSNFIFDRKLKLPIIGSLSIDMILREYSQDKLDGFLNKTNTYDIIIDHKIDPLLAGNEGDFFADEISEKLYINIGDSEWKSTSHGQGSTEENTSISSSQKEYFSGDYNFYYARIKDSLWLKVPLEESFFQDQEADVFQKIYQNNYIHIKTESSWVKFLVEDLVLDNDLIEGLSFESKSKLVNNITFEINNAQLQNQSYSHEIGSDVMVSSALSFGVSRDDGLKLYPRFLARVAPVWVTNIDNITHEENDESPLNYDKNIDLGDSKVSFSLGGADSEYFEVHPNGNIFFIESPDFEIKSSYALSVTATNESGHSLKNINVQIVDKVDSNPVWSLTEETINHPEGTNIVEYNQDLNIDPTHAFYGLSGEDKKYFSLSSSGELSFRFTPDFETAIKKDFDIFITAYNQFGNTSKYLNIQIVNVQDAAPEWVSSTDSINVERGSLSSLLISSEIKEFEDYPVFYTLSGPDSHLFEISSTGEIRFIGDPHLVNKTALYFEARVFNSAGSSSKQFKIEINQLISFENSRVVFQKNEQGDSVKIGAVLKQRLYPAYIFQEDYSVPSFVYFALTGYGWFQVPLTESEFNSDESLNFYEEGDKIFTDNFVHIYTNSGGWMKTAITQ